MEELKGARGGFRLLHICRGMAAFLCLLLLMGFAPLCANTIIPCANTIKLLAPPVQINDGDTFEADLNRDGRLEFPRERVRLLYVDAPELSLSHKGRDWRFGPPAKAFLLDALKALPITLWVDPAHPLDYFGRTLAVLYAGESSADENHADKNNVNLRLIRRGHSYFDTRFSFPNKYELYARAEAAAFEERLGIWSSAASRAAYLARLRKEGKSPRAPGNPRFVPGLHSTSRVDIAAYKGRFLQIRGRLLRRRPLRNAAWLLYFAGAGSKHPLVVYVPRRTSLKLPVRDWPIGAEITMDGFAQIYRGRPQLRLHHGRVQAPPPDKG